MPRPEFIPSGTPDDTYGYITIEDPRVGAAVQVVDPRSIASYRRFADINVPVTEDNSAPEETPEEEPMPF